MLFLHLCSLCSKTPKTFEAGEGGLCWQQLWGMVPHVLMWALLEHAGIAWDTQSRHPSIPPEPCQPGTRGWLVSVTTGRAGGHHTRGCLCTKQLPARHFLVSTNYPEVEETGETWRRRMHFAELTRKLFLQTVRAWCSTAAEGEKEMKAQQSKCFAVTFVLDCKLGVGRAWWQSSTHQQQGLSVHQEPEAIAQPAGQAAEAMLKVV